MESAALNPVQSVGGIHNYSNIQNDAKTTDFLSIITMMTSSQSSNAVNSQSDKSIGGMFCNLCSQDESASENILDMIMNFQADEQSDITAGGLAEILSNALPKLDLSEIISGAINSDSAQMNSEILHQSDIKLNLNPVNEDELNILLGIENSEGDAESGIQIIENQSELQSVKAESEIQLMGAESYASGLIFEFANDDEFSENFELNDIIDAENDKYADMRNRLDSDDEQKADANEGEIVESKINVQNALGLIAEYVAESGNQFMQDAEFSLSEAVELLGIQDASISSQEIISYFKENQDNISNTDILKFISKFVSDGWIQDSSTAQNSEDNSISDISVQNANKDSRTLGMLYNIAENLIKSGNADDNWNIDSNFGNGSMDNNATDENSSNGIRNVIINAASGLTTNVLSQNDSEYGDSNHILNSTQEHSKTEPNMHQNNTHNFFDNSITDDAYAYNAQTQNIQSSSKDIFTAWSSRGAMQVERASEYYGTAMLNETDANNFTSKSGISAEGLSVQISNSSELNQSVFGFNIASDANAENKLLNENSGHMQNNALSNYLSENPDELSVKNGALDSQRINYANLNVKHNIGKADESAYLSKGTIISAEVNTNDTNAKIIDENEFYNAVRSVKNSLNNAEDNSNTQNLDASESEIINIGMQKASFQEIGTSIDTNISDEKTDIYNVKSQITDAVSEQLKINGTKDFTVKLSPEGLGEISIKFTKKSEEISVILSASKETTEKLILDKLSDLQSTLKLQNSQIKNITVENPEKASEQMNHGNMDNQSFTNGRNFNQSGSNFNNSGTLSQTALKNDFTDAISESDEHSANKGLNQQQHNGKLNILV